MIRKGATGASLCLGLALLAAPLGPGLSQPALAQEGERSVASAYLKLSEHDDARVRAKAVQMLGGLSEAERKGEPRALLRVLTLLRSDESLLVRRSAASAAAQFGAPKQVAPALAVALGDAVLEVRVSAAAALGVLGPGAAPALPKLRTCLSATSDAVLQIETCRALAKIGAKARPARPELLVCLGDPKRARLIRESAALALGSLGEGHPKTLRALLTGLKDASSGLREASARALTALGPAAAPASLGLAEALTHKDAMTRWRSAMALGAVGPKAKTAVPALLKALDKDLSRDIRAEAANALGAIGDAQALPALRAHLARKREHHTVQLAVERAIRAIESPPKR